MRNTKRSLYTARRIMYGNILPRYPDVVLEDDRLTGRAYEALWSAEDYTKTVYTACPNIFSSTAKVIIDENFPILCE